MHVDSRIGQMPTRVPRVFGLERVPTPHGATPVYLGEAGKQAKRVRGLRRAIPTSL